MQRLLMGLILAVAVASASRARADQPGPFTDVPSSHWSYQAVDQLERQGLFTGYPAGTFTGKRALTRYEFGVALQRLVTDANRTPEARGLLEGPLLRQIVIRRLGLVKMPSPSMEPLRKLLQEFKPELVMLGSNLDQLAGDLTGSGKENKEVPLPPRPAKPSAGWTEGVKQAQEEWQKGAITLYGYGFPGGGPYIDPQLGLPRKGIAGCLVDQRTRDRAAGHNDEVYRLILERGLPPNAHRQRLSAILEPATLWKKGDEVPVRLDPTQSQRTAPDGGLRLRWKKDDEIPDTSIVEIRSGEGTVDLRLLPLPDPIPYVEVLWGPAKDGILFLRAPGRDGKHSGHHHWVMDLRTGILLNHVFTATPPPDL